MEVKGSEVLWPLSSVLWELRLLGLWVPPPGRRLRHRLILAFVMVSHVANFLGAFASITMDTPSDLPQLSFIAYNCLIDAGLACKMFSFSLDGQRLTELLRLLAASRRRFPDKAGHRARYKATAVKLRRFMQVTYRINNAYWFLAPIVRNIMAAVSKNISTSERVIPLPIWLPFDLRSSPVYEIVYSLEMASGLAVSETTVLVDGTLIALILQVVAELAVVNDHLADGATAALKHTPSEVTIIEGKVQDSNVQVPLKSSSFFDEGATYDLLHSGNSKSSKSETYQQLVGNIQHYQTIVSCVNLLQEILSRATSVLLFCTTVCICFQVIATAVVLQKDMDIVESLKMLMGSSLYAYQVALFCLLGQRIINQSEQLMRSAFGGGWPDGDIRCWRLLYMLCLSTSRALSLKICGIYTLSRMTLLQILNVSYSLLNFIYQAKAEQSVAKQEL
ncbi:odorant receptor 83a-like [Schistocerca gregaria]|uniref:odorant receptor 83a-like n=1 Tax=Schistocerca gregaria TaxID=7010 RepID=UPI00211E7701|nr:odorant receptor 83a-like [Schistocerca gregaria]